MHTHVHPLHVHGTCMARAYRFGPFLSAETFLATNLLFYIPFVGAFATDPNMVFGPATPTGFPMCTTGGDRTSAPCM